MSVPPGIESKVWKQESLVPISGAVLPSCCVLRLHQPMLPNLPPTDQQTDKDRFPRECNSGYV